VAYDTKIAFANKNLFLVL